MCWMGFVLSPDEAQALIAKDLRNKDVLFPYLNGEDLNSVQTNHLAVGLLTFMIGHWRKLKHTLIA